MEVKEIKSPDSYPSQNTAQIIKNLKKEKRCYFSYPVLLSIAFVSISSAILVYLGITISNTEASKKYHSLIDQYSETPFTNGTTCQDLLDFAWSHDAEGPVGIDVCETYQIGAAKNLPEFCLNLLDEACITFALIPDYPALEIVSTMLGCISLMCIVSLSYNYLCRKRDHNEFASIPHLLETAETLQIPLNNRTFREVIIDLVAADNAITQYTEAMVVLNQGKSDKNKKSPIYHFFKDYRYDNNLLKYIFSFIKPFYSKPVASIVEIKEEPSIENNETNESGAFYHRLG